MSKSLRNTALVASFSVLISGTAAAIVIGPSNLPLFGYPDHRCDAPSMPFSNDRYAWEGFRSDANRYIDCINEYVDAGNNDIQRIQESQQEALREANSFISRMGR